MNRPAWRWPLLFCLLAIALASATVCSAQGYYGEEGGGTNLGATVGSILGVAIWIWAMSAMWKQNAQRKRIIAAADRIRLGQGDLHGSTSLTEEMAISILQGDKQAENRVAAAFRLAETPSVASGQALVQAGLDDPDPEVRVAACGALIALSKRFGVWNSRKIGTGRGIHGTFGARGPFAATLAAATRAIDEMEGG